jgi:hypothetical protein
VKTFRYPLHDNFPIGVTMTVAEVREKLAEFPPDMPVIAEWEGTWNYFAPVDFRVERHGKCRSEDDCDCLVVNVDGQ